MTDKDPPKDGAMVKLAPMGSAPQVPQLFVEQLALGELDATIAQAVRDRLAGEPGGEQRLDRIAADNAATLEALPPADIARRIEARAARANGHGEVAKPRPWLLFGAPALAAAAAAMIIVVVSGQPTDETTMLAPPNSPLSTERSKGAPGAPRSHVLVSLKRSDGGFDYLSDGATVRRGDLVQVGYLAVTERYGAIVSIDGRGAVSWHLPATGNGQAAALKKNGERWLDDAYQLDDAPDFERFFIVTSVNPFDVRAVDKAAQSLARKVRAARQQPLQLDTGLVQSTLLLRKAP